MPVDDLYAFPEGKVGFAGSDRGIDECGHDIFKIEIPNRPLLYGEWLFPFENDNHSFSIYISKFGYNSKSNVPSTNPSTRVVFSKNEKNNIVTLVNKLFSNENARKFFIPFSMKNTTFTGKVYFAPDWIRIFEG